MDDKNLHKKHFIEGKGHFHKGQRIIYKGEDAEILSVTPVLTIKVKGKNHVVCGNILNDISLLQWDKRKENIKVSEIILKNTTHCRNSFACLSGETESMCEVIQSVSAYHVVAIKPNSIDSCKYFVHLDNTIYCLCPTRNEIYNRYEM